MEPTYRAGKPAALASASRCVISCRRVWPAVSKSANCWPVWHQLPRLSPLCLRESRFRRVCAAVKKSGQIFISRGAVPLCGVESVMARLAAGGQLWSVQRGAGGRPCLDFSSPRHSLAQRMLNVYAVFFESLLAATIFQSFFALSPSSSRR